jgi:hypothetical protein
MDILCLIIDVWMSMKDMKVPDSMPPKTAMRMGLRYMALLIGKHLYDKGQITLLEGATLARRLGVDETDVLGNPQTGKKGWEK